MPRKQAFSDAFSAIAEPRRRELLRTFGRSTGERDVTWLVNELGWPQPQVSKHLGVLRKAGLVNVERKGKRRMYSLNAHNLRPVYEWVKFFEQFWGHQLHRLKEHAERMQRESAAKPPSSP